MTTDKDRTDVTRRQAWRRYETPMLVDLAGPRQGHAAWCEPGSGNAQVCGTGTAAGACGTGSGGGGG